MKLAIHQPEFFPWIGFFNKMSKVDKFVLLDNVQYETGNFQSRNRIIGVEKPQYIIVPIEKKGYLRKSLKDIKIQSEIRMRWKRKFLATIYYHYYRHPYFQQYYPHIEKLVNSEIDSLCDFNIKVILWWASELGIQPEFVRASELNVFGSKSSLLVDICKKTNADIYISGVGAKNYMDITMFEDNEIEVIFNQYIPRKYFQHGREEFVPYLSTLDLLMNVGAANAKEIVWN